MGRVPVSGYNVRILSYDVARLHPVFCMGYVYWPVLDVFLTNSEGGEMFGGGGEVPSIFVLVGG